MKPFMITKEVWNGKHCRVYHREPVIGMVAYADAAKMFGYSKSRVAHLVSTGRVRGGSGLVSVEEMGDWAKGRPEKPRVVLAQSALVDVDP